MHGLHVVNGDSERKFIHAVRFGGAPTDYERPIDG
jgi:hypothetical protein